MDPSAIPPEVRRLVALAVPSLSQLELLLLLRADPSKAWTAAEAARAVFMSAAEAGPQLQALQERGLLGIIASAEPVFWYSPKDEEMAAAVGALERLYTTHRLLVVSLVSAQPSPKLKTFADAFRLRNGGDR